MPPGRLKSSAGVENHCLQKPHCQKRGWLAAFQWVAVLRLNGSGDATAQADAAGMLAAVKGGQLVGILNNKMHYIPLENAVKNKTKISDEWMKIVKILAS